MFEQLVLEILASGEFKVGVCISHGSLPDNPIAENFWIDLDKSENFKIDRCDRTRLEDLDIVE